MRRRYYDAQSINRDIPIEDVMEMYGWDCGGKKNISCPNKEIHKNGDKKPSAKIYKNNNICFCFACSTAFTPIKVVETLEGVSFLEACENLVEQFNLSENYYEENTTYSSEEKDVFPLTFDEIELLGLKHGFIVGENVVGGEFDYNDYDENDNPIEVYKPKIEKSRYGLRELWKDDNIGFNEMILSKVTEQIEKYPIDSDEYKTLRNISLKIKGETSDVAEIKQTLQEKEKVAFQKIADLVEHFETNQESIAEYFAFSSRFYKYSPRNVMLIMQQNPGATFVESYNRWKEKGGQVQKGQHGMNILVPVKVKYLNLKNGEKWIPLSKATPQQKEMASKGEIEVKTLSCYKIGTVFDISQTNYPKSEYPKLFHMGYESKQHEEICQGIIAFAQKELHCDVRSVDLTSIALMGRYYREKSNGMPAIELNDKMESTQKLSTLTHEIGHALLHSTVDEKSVAQKEFEADAVSIMLASHYGVELTDSRKAHLAEHAKQFKHETISKLDGATADKVKVWNKKMFDSFSSVYKIFEENIDNIELHVKEQLSRKEETIPEAEVKQEKGMDVDMPEKMAPEEMEQEDFVPTVGTIM